MTYWTPPGWRAVLLTDCETMAGWGFWSCVFASSVRAVLSVGAGVNGLVLDCSAVPFTAGWESELVWADMCAVDFLYCLDDIRTGQVYNDCRVLSPRFHGSTRIAAVVIDNGLLDRFKAEVLESEAFRWDVWQAGAVKDTGLMWLKNWTGVIGPDVDFNGVRWKDM